MVTERHRCFRHPPSIFLLVALAGGCFAFAAPAWGQVTETLKLVPDDSAAGDEFGFAVAVDAGILAVGARSDDDNGPDSEKED